MKTVKPLSRTSATSSQMDFRTCRVVGVLKPGGCEGSRFPWKWAGSRRQLVIGLCLAVFTLSVYWQVKDHEFINYDDQEYVTENRMVQEGLNWAGVRWSFTTFHAANWHPLTWLSHMLDVELFGMDPSGHHLSSVALHVVNTLLLFLLLERMTGALWRSAFVAALFALHPLHVESVAWVAERKDVLSTALGLLTLMAYHGYARRPGAARYGMVLVLFALSLMAKPMLVTLPFLMLLLDFWPLGRTCHCPGQLKPESAARSRSCLHSFIRLLIEKLPLFTLSLASCLVTLAAQKSAMPPYTLVPMSTRLCNAALSYAGYLLKALWPQDLAVFYPLRVPCQAAPFWLSLAAILLLTVLVLRYAFRKPACMVGWFWYLGALVPVIGIVQVGGQAMADRYTYLPLVGIFIMAVWAVGGSSLRTGTSATVAVLCIFLLSALAAKTWVQLGYWKNDLALFSHCVAATPGNQLAHSILGHTLVKQKRYEEARLHLMKAASRQGNTVLEHVLFFNLGIVEEAAGRPEKALQHFLQAVRLKPDRYDYHFNAGILSGKLGDNAAAVEHLTAALRLDPEQAEIHYNLGVALVELGEYGRAMHHYAEALRLRPNHADTHNNMGVALARRGAMREAAIHFEEALRLDPGFADAQLNLRAARNRLQSLPQP